MPWIWVPVATPLIVRLVPEFRIATPLIVAFKVELIRMASSANPLKARLRTLLPLALLSTSPLRTAALPLRTTLCDVPRRAMGRFTISCCVSVKLEVTRISYGEPGISGRLLIVVIA